MSTSDNPVKAGPSRAVRIAIGLALTVIVSAVGLLAGVGMAAMLGRLGDRFDWGTLGDVGQTFGALSAIISGLALTAVVLFSRAQSHELRENRRELERQGQLLARSHAELQRAAEAGRGRLHLEILKLAMDDPELAEVWPPFEAGLSAKQNRQFLYANAIFQYQQTWMTIGGHSPDEVVATMRYLFTNPIMRDYWSAAAHARSSLVPGTEEHTLAQRVDEIWRDYEAVAAARPKAARRKVKDLRISEPKGSPEAPEAA